MRSIALAGLLSLAAVSTAVAQSSNGMFHSGDAAVTYQRVESNAPPGQCGCFGANGGGASLSLKFRPGWAAVAEVSADYAGNGPGTGNSLTLVSYMAGARYTVLHAGIGHFQPFGQVLVGAAHAGGGIAGAGDHASVFAARVGGGVDLPLTPRFALRLAQVDYYPTMAANAVNDHQNNLLLATGIVLRWLR